MKRVSISALTGTFAEDKDVAAHIRTQVLLPTLRAGHEVELDFLGIDGATQSFVHALVSDVIRQLGPDVLDRIRFRNCQKTVQSIVRIVTEYSQDGLSDAD